MSASRLPLSAIVDALAAAGEPTRLRLLALMFEAELTVTELTTILGQSQPRISRHLKLLVEAGLVSRHREGAWAFFRLSADNAVSTLVSNFMAALDPDDATLRADRLRLAEIRSERAAAAADYFARHAGEWDRIRRLHASDREVEEAVLAALGPGSLGDVLDLGTGTGRMLEVLAPRARRAVGVDVSPAMLAVARVNLEKAGVRNVQLRQADAYALPADVSGFDLIILHQVLHYLDDPARAIREAARALDVGGRLVVIDFAPHAIEELRVEHAHRRLGFSSEEIARYLDEAGLDAAGLMQLGPGADRSMPLTVSIWIGRERTLRGDFPLNHSTREVA